MPVSHFDALTGERFMIRTDRSPMETRPCTIQPGFVETAAGSCLISTGKTA